MGLSRRSTEAENLRDINATAYGMAERVEELIRRLTDERRLDNALAHELNEYAEAFADIAMTSAHGLEKPELVMARCPVATANFLEAARSLLMRWLATNKDINPKTNFLWFDTNTFLDKIDRFKHGKVETDLPAQGAVL